MRHFVDKELKGHALVFDGPLEMVRKAAEVQKEIEAGMKGLKYEWDHPRNRVYMEPRVNFVERKANTWDEIQDFLKTPWPTAVKQVSYVVRRIMAEKLPEPKSVRRRGRWDENDGETDLDRLLLGDPDYMRRHFREQIGGPTSVTLICNLDTFTAPNKVGVYWRSCTAIAASDVLEQLGYSTELWMWCKGGNVYQEPNHEQFTCCRVKEAGAPLDLDAVCDSLSHWFTVKGIFATFAVLPEAKSIGYADHQLGAWEKYLDVEGAMKVYVPIVFGPDEAIQAAKNVLRWVKLGGQNSPDDVLPEPLDGE